MKLKNFDINFNIDHEVSSDPDIGHVDLFAIQTLLSLFSSLIKSGIRLILGNGFPLGWILEMAGLDFISLSKTQLEPYDEYFIFFTSPEFNPDKLDLSWDRLKKLFNLASWFLPTDDLPINFKQGLLTVNEY